MGDVKIVSLLPSATEIVFALGLGDQLEGVSFECDYPAAARQVPIVSGTVLPVEEQRDAAQVDAEVSALIAAGESIYTLDNARIRSIAPDLILAQDLCRVCAVPSGAVEEALGVIGCQADVVSLDPEGLDEVIACVGQVGRATGTEARAETLMTNSANRVAAVRTRVQGRPPRVFVLEWPDPPFNAGHWVPEMVEAAGGEPVLAEARARSVRVTWEEIAGGRHRHDRFQPVRLRPGRGGRAGGCLPGPARGVRAWPDRGRGRKCLLLAPRSPRRRRGRAPGRVAPSAIAGTPAHWPARTTPRSRPGALEHVATRFRGSDQSFRATSGPVIRSNRGNVEAMMASEATSPPTTVAQ